MKKTEKCCDDTMYVSIWIMDFLYDEHRKVQRGLRLDIKKEEISKVISDLMEYFGLAYYEGKICTKEQAEKIREAIEKNTKLIK